MAMTTVYDRNDDKTTITLLWDTFHRIVKARELQMRHRTKNVLADLDQEALAAHGHDRRTHRDR
jgi:hypothetical protein